MLRAAPRTWPSEAAGGALNACEQIFVLDERAFERLQDHAAGEKLFGNGSRAAIGRPRRSIAGDFLEAG